MKLSLKFQHSRRPNGFTLLEVILALAVVSIGLVTAMQAYFFIGRSYVSARNHAQALYLLEKQIHQVRMEPTNKRTLEGTFDEPYEEFQWQAKRSAKLPNGVRHIELSVWWKERGAEKAVSTLAAIRKVDEKK